MADKSPSTQNPLLAWASGSILLLVIHFSVSILTVPSIGAVISLFAGSGLEPPLLSNVSVWLLYFFGFYQMFRGLGDEEFTDRWPTFEPFFANKRTAAMIAGFAITTALGVGTFVLDTSRMGNVADAQGLTSSFLFWLLVAFALATAVFAAYLSASRSSGEIDALSAPLFRRALSDDDVTQAWRQDSRWAASFRTLVFLNEAAVVVFAALLLGIVTAVIWLFYPLPELVILSSSVYLVVNHYRSGNARRGGQTIDPESPFVKTVLTITSSPKGLVTAPLLVMGLFLSSVPFVLGGQAILSPSSGGLALAAFPPLSSSQGLPQIAYGIIRVWYLLGFVLGGVLAYWYWYRVAKRLPDFLTAWRSVDIERIVYDTEDEQPETTEPRATVRRPETETKAALGVVILVASYPSFRRIYDPVFVDIGFIVLFILVVGMAAFVVWDTIRGEPQAALTDAEAIPEAFATQMLFTAFLLVMLDSEFVLATLVGTLVTVPPFFGIYFSPDIGRLADQSDDWRRYGRLLTGLAVSGWFVFCGLLLVLVPLLSSPVAVPLVLIGGGCAVYFIGTFLLTRIV